jgi:hypothetical protein
MADFRTIAAHPDVVDRVIEESTHAKRPLCETATRPWTIGRPVNFARRGALLPPFRMRAEDPGVLTRATPPGALVDAPGVWRPFEKERTDTMSVGVR